MKSNYELVAERHRDFWMRRNPEALIGYAPKSHLFPLRNLPIRHEGIFRPEDLSDAILECESRYCPDFHADDALLPAKIPLEFMEWTQAYCGAEIHCSTMAGTLWSHPASIITQRKEFEIQPNPAWLERLLEGTRANLRTGRSLCESLLRGPADCLEALLGAELLSLLIYDAPEQLHRLMEQATDAVMVMTREQQRLLPRLDGSTINRYRLCNHGDNIVTQADISGIFSPSVFAEHFLPHYRRLAEAFDCVTYHCHATARQHLKALIDSGIFDAIEIALDPVGPSWEELLPDLRAVQAADQALIIMNIVSDEEEQYLLRNLSPQGLCLIKRR